MKNRIITYITAIMMIISMPSVFADSESSPAVNPSFVRDLEFINMLGIADETDTSDAHRIVTRAEFTHLIVNMLNFSHIQNQKDLFADVGSSSKYADAIYSALELGIVSGTGDSYFRPDDAITYDAAIKMTVSALGYDKLAVVKGAYPAGYIMVAHSLDITDGVSREFTFDDAVVLISNALRAEVWTLESVQGSDITYSAGTNVTLLSENFDLKYTSGTVTTAGVYSATRGYESAESKMEIYGKMYGCTIENAEKYLGYSVDAWYDKDDNIVAVYPHSETGELKVDAADVVSYSDFEITVDTGDKEKDYSLDKGYCFVLNGRFHIPKTSDFIYENGVLKLIDSDGDNKYDFVISEKLEYFVVTAVNDHELMIYDNNFAPAVSISLSPYDNICGNIRIYNCLTGVYSKATYDDIDKGSVLEVYKSSDGKLVNIDILTSNTVKGAVEEIGDEAVIIGGAEYELTDYFRSSGKQIVIGQPAQYLISSDGRIIMRNVSSDVMRYGYFLDFAPQSGFKKAKIKLLSEENTVEVYELCDTVKVNGSSVNSDDASISSALISGEFPIYQIIRYSVNSKGEFAVLDTFTDAPDDARVPTKPEGQDSLLRYAEKTQVLYKSTGNLIVPFGSMEQSVKFYVPSALISDGGTATYDDSYFVCGDSSRVDNDDTPSVDVYDMNENHFPGAVVIYNMVGGTANSVNPTQYDPSYMVESVTQASDAEGNDSIKLTLRDTSGSKSYTVDYDVYQEYLKDKKIPKKGDLVRIVLDEKPEIIGYAIDCSYDSKTGSFTINYGKAGLSNNIRERYTLAAGKVVSFGDGLMTIEATNLGTGGTLALNNGKIGYWCNAERAVLYSGERNMIRLISASDILSEAQSGEGVSDTVVIRSTFFSASTIFVYRNE